LASLISSVTGKISELSLNSLTIDISGIGISAQITARHAAKLQLGTSATIYTNLTVREDSLTLYGFETLHQRDFFELLQTVTGIGPKLALSILSAADVADISRAIAGEDLKRLQEIPGMGKKSAQRLVIDLRDKIKIKGGKINDWQNQLVQALESLGYTAKESIKISDQVAKDLSTEPIKSGAEKTDINVSEALKLALQIAGRNKRG
jgi:Holliday junction DNA helicase RuvA